MATEVDLRRIRLVFPEVIKNSYELRPVLPIEGKLFGRLREDPEARSN